LCPGAGQWLPFFRRLLKSTGQVPQVVVTDKLASYAATHRQVMPLVEHRFHKGLNNRAENSHQPTRQREHARKNFRGPGAARRLLSAFTGISPHFRPHRHLMTAGQYRFEMMIRLTLWNHATDRIGMPTTG
jgi:putative transposase